MDMNSGVITIDADAIPNTISIERAALMPIKENLKTRITPRPVPAARATILHNTDVGCEEPLKYVGDKVTDHYHTSDLSMYRVRRDG